MEQDSSHVRVLAIQGEENASVVRVRVDSSTSTMMDELRYGVTTLASVNGRRSNEIKYHLTHRLYWTLGMYGSQTIWCQDCAMKVWVK